MVIFTALLLLLGRSAGRVLNTVFGWAVVLFFGRLPEERQLYLSLMAFGSVGWLLVLLGIPFPEFGALLLAFVTLPPWVDRTWIRLGMALATLLLPPAVGLFALRTRDPGERPAPKGDWPHALLSGYPYALGTACALVLMTLFAPLLRLNTLRRLWTTQHMPVSLPRGEYEPVVLRIAEALRELGWEVRVQPASLLLRLPAWVLTLLAGPAVRTLIQPHLLCIRAPACEVLAHPADLTFNGKEAAVVQARAAVAEKLAFSAARLIWSGAGRTLENRLAQLWRRLEAPVSSGLREDALRELDEIEAELRSARVPYEEWEVLFRESLLLYRRLARTPVD